MSIEQQMQASWARRDRNCWIYYSKEDVSIQSVRLRSGALTMFGAFRYLGSNVLTFMHFHFVMWAGRLNGGAGHILN